MVTPHHASMKDAAGAYVLGCLDDDERAVFEGHIAGCDECAAEVRAFGRVATALAGSAGSQAPAPELRAGLLRSLTARAAFARFARVGRAWLPLAAMLAVAVGAALFALTLQRRVAVLEEDARQVNSALQSSMAVLAAPDLVRIDLQGQQPAPDATGRALWSRARGMVFTSSALPPLPSGRTYQIWVVTAPRLISAGLLDADSAAGSRAFFATPPDIPSPTAVAVTVEPAGGVPAPTGPAVLAGVPAPAS